MNSNSIIISLIYYIGIASCAAQGAEKGKYKNNIPILHYMANAFGGGFIRDVIFLNIHPWLLTPSALPDLTIVVIIGFLYTYYFFIFKVSKKYYRIIMRFVTITDALGLGSFICIGMDKAFVYSNNIFIIITCGYITAIGGGILASGKSFTKILKNKKIIYYHLVTLLGCYYYYIFKHSLYLVCFIAIGLFLSNVNYRTLYNIYFYNLMTPYYEILFLHPIICNKNNKIQRQRIIKVKKIDIYPKRPKIYLIQQRIRQC